MEKDYFNWEWKKLLVDMHISETEAARRLGVGQAGLNKKIRLGTIRAIDLANILEHFGYTLRIVKLDK